MQHANRARARCASKAHAENPVCAICTHTCSVSSAAQSGPQSPAPHSLCCCWGCWVWHAHVQAQHHARRAHHAVHGSQLQLRLLQVRKSKMMPGAPLAISLGLDSAIWLTPLAATHCASDVPESQFDNSTGQRRRIVPISRFAAQETSHTVIMHRTLVHKAFDALIHILGEASSRC